MCHLSQQATGMTAGTTGFEKEELLTSLANIIKKHIFN